MAARSMLTAIDDSLVLFCVCDLRSPVIAKALNGGRIQLVLSQGSGWMEA